MKRALSLAFIILALSVAASAQATFFSGVAQTVATIPGSAQGLSNVFVPIPNAKITVCTGIMYPGQQCLTQTAQIYADSGMTMPISPYALADQYGNFQFWALPGSYYYTIVGQVNGSVVSSTYQIQLPVSIGSNFTNPVINATTGFQYNGAAPANHVLLGNGSYYVDSATIPASIITGLPGSNYQTVQAASVNLPAEPKLNFASPAFLLSDASGNGQTNVNLSITGADSTLVTAPGPGTAGDCAEWTSSGDLTSSAQTCANIVQSLPDTASPATYSSIQSASTSSGCTTGASSYDVCTMSVTWPHAFADSTYQVSCTGIGPTDTGNPTSGRAVMNGIVAQTPASVTVQFATQGSSAISFTGMSCIAMQNVGQ